MSYDRQIVLQLHTERFEGAVDLLATRLHHKARSAGLPSENIMMVVTHQGV